MNKQQREYVIAKANFQVAEKNLEAAEKEYIVTNGIRNPDGTTPEALWMLDDEELFEKHIDLFQKLVDEAGLDETRNRAKEELRKAENELIKFGLSITPSGMRRTLADGVKNKATIRERFIDTVFRLDTATI